MATMLSPVHGFLKALEGFKRFKGGRDDRQYDPGSGRSSTTRNTDTIANVLEMETQDGR
jgi:hypothetical protein